MASSQESLKQIAVNTGSTAVSELKSSQEYLEEIAVNTANMGGGGDMSTATYDPDEDGQVEAADTADSVPWTGVTGKPSSYPSTISDVSGLQSALDTKLTASQAEAQADSDGADLVADFNALLAKLRAAGIMAE